MLLIPSHCIRPLRTDFSHLTMPGSTARPTSARLAGSSYNSPYSRAGAPSPHPNTDPYAPLRARALSTLEAIGLDPNTMVEHGVLWAEHQDPYGHVMQSQFMQFAGGCFFRVMESYDEYLSKEECDDLIQGKSVIPAVRRYELNIRRQLKYPDAVRGFFLCYNIHLPSNCPADRH